MVAIFPSRSTVGAKTLEREINEIATAIYLRKQKITDIEKRLNAIASTLGKTEVSPQQKKLWED